MNLLHADSLVEMGRIFISRSHTLDNYDSTKQDLRYANDCFLVAAKVYRNYSVQGTPERSQEDLHKNLMEVREIEQQLAESVRGRDVAILHQKSMM